MTDDVIGDSTYIELADGLTVTVGVVDDQALLVIPGGGAHLLMPDDAVRLGQALVECGQQASAESAARAGRGGRNRRRADGA